MILETLVAAFGLSVLGGIYLTLAPADRDDGDCGSCSLKEDPGLCGGCGLPEIPPPDAQVVPEPDVDVESWSPDTGWSDEPPTGGAAGPDSRSNGWRGDTR